MAKQTINIGAFPNDDSGDNLRTGGQKINDNFTELYGDVEFTNANPTPVTIGGILAGTNFPIAVKVKDLWSQLLYPYIKPGIVLNTSPAAGVSEVGVELAPITLTAVTAKNSNPIVGVVFYRENSIIHVVTSPNAVGGTEVFVHTPSEEQNTVSFKAKVQDGADEGWSAVKVFTKVFPFLHGANAANTGINPYTALTKLVATKSNKSIALSGTSKYFWFGYPASYGNLAAIIDNNGFDVTSGWTKTTPVSIHSSGIDVNWNENYTFYITNAPTDINATFQFRF